MVKSVSAALIIEMRNTTSARVCSRLLGLFTRLSSSIPGRTIGAARLQRLMALASSIVSGITISRRREIMRSVELQATGSSTSTPTNGLVPMTAGLGKRASRPKPVCLHGPLLSAHRVHGLPGASFIPAAIRAGAVSGVQFTKRSCPDLKRIVVAGHGRVRLHAPDYRSSRL